MDISFKIFWKETLLTAIAFGLIVFVVQFLWLPVDSKIEDEEKNECKAIGGKLTKTSSVNLCVDSNFIRGKK